MIKLGESAIKTIEEYLQRGERIELIPNKDGFRIIHIKRKEIKHNDVTGL